MYIHLGEHAYIEDLAVSYEASWLFRPKAAFNIAVPPRPHRTLRAPGRPRTWQGNQDLARRPLLAPVGFR